MGKQSAQRTNQAERVKFALKHRKAGKSFVEVTEMLKEHYGISDRQAGYDLAAVRDIVVAQLKERVPFLAEEILEKLFDTYEASRMGDEPNYNAAVAALREAGKLAGVYAPERVEHTMSPEQYESGLAELRAHAIETAEDGVLIAELERRGIKVAVDA